MVEGPAREVAPALMWRHVVQERLRLLFPPGARVLNLGSGCGADALFLASCGVTVLGLDARADKVHSARRAATAAGARVRFEVRGADALRLEDGIFDGVFSGFGVLDQTLLPALGRTLPAALRPGSPVLLSLAAPRPAVARYGARARAQRLLGREFTWSAGFGLGVVLPGPEQSAWAASHPQAFGILAALDRLVRRWPVTRDLGHHLVLDGRRR
jgi:methyltransferase family protein